MGEYLNQSTSIDFLMAISENSVQPIHAHSDSQNSPFIIVISLLQKLFSKNIGRRDVDQKQTYNSPSNIFLIHDYYKKLLWKI